MLAYYTALIKKEEVLNRISLDLEKIAEIANELVCDIKIASVSCREKNIEDTVQKCKESEELCKIVTAMVKNCSSNLTGYLQALASTEKPTEDKKETTEVAEESLETKKAENQLGSLVEALKSLKEMKESLNEK